MANDTVLYAFGRTDDEDFGLQKCLHPLNHLAHRV